MTTNGGKPVKLNISSRKGSISSDAGLAATPATETPRPILKINTGSRQPSFSGDPASAQTPSAAGDKPRTIKIKFGGAPSTPSTPAETQSSIKTKAGRSSKPTAKLIESKKRVLESDDDAEPRSANMGPPQKKIMIKPNSAKTPTTPFTPNIKFKSKGERVKHKPGDAWDSEASDKEEDPVREQPFVLRLLPGEAAEYLREKIAANMIGETGTDFAIKFFDAKERRATVKAKGMLFAAVLVDLPTITEAMKTWDRKSMMKNSDISQMLLCFARVKDEAEARTVPLPPTVGKADLKWPHGLTPPMHDCVNRRFRKTITEKQVKSRLNQVQDLIKRDAEFGSSRIEFINDDDEVYDEDAEGEMEEDDYFGDAVMQEEDQPEMEIDAEFENELQNEFEAELFADGDMAGAETEPATPAATQLDAATPMATHTADTPAAQHYEEEEEDEDEDESEEDEDEDEDTIQANNERKMLMDDLAELNQQKEKLENELKHQTNNILKKRVQKTLDNVKAEIAVKKAALGIRDDE